MRQNIALIIIAVVVFAGAAGVLAMTNITKTNQTQNISSANNNNAAANNNTANNANKQTSSSSSSSSSSSNDDGGDSDPGDQTGDTCPTCMGAGVINNPGSGSTQSVCPTCGGDGVV